MPLAPPRPPIRLGPFSPPTPGGTPGASPGGAGASPGTLDTRDINNRFGAILGGPHAPTVDLSNIEFGAQWINLELAPDRTIAHQMDGGSALQMLQGALDASTEPALAALDGASYADQQAAVLDVLQWVADFYKYCNVRPQSDPLYVAWWRDTFAGVVVPYSWDDAGWKRTNGVGPSIIVHANWGKGIGARINGEWNRLGKEQINADFPLDGIVIRVELDERAGIIAQCMGDRNGTGACDFREGVLFIGTAQAGASHEGVDRWDWRSWAWNDPPPLPGRAGAWPRVSRCLPPLRWFAEAYGDLARRIAARTDTTQSSVAGATAVQAARYTLLFNLAEARMFNTLPARLRDMAANLPENIDAAEEQAQQGNAEMMRQTVGAMASAYGGTFGQIYAAVIEAVASILPAATAVQTDRFGRALPFLATYSIFAESGDSGLLPSELVDHGDGSGTSGDAPPIAAPAPPPPPVPFYQEPAVIVGAAVAVPTLLAVLWKFASKASAFVPKRRRKRG